MLTPADIWPAIAIITTVTTLVVVALALWATDLETWAANRRYRKAAADRRRRHAARQRARKVRS